MTRQALFTPVRPGVQQGNGWPTHVTRIMPAGRSAHGLTHYRKPGSVVLLCMGGHGYGFEYFGDMWSLELPITPAQAPPAPAEPEISPSQVGEVTCSSCGPATRVPR